MILFINNYFTRPTLPEKCKELYDRVVNYNDKTEENITIEGYKWQPLRRGNILNEIYSGILEIIEIINKGDNYQPILNKLIVNITPLYNVVNILVFFSKEFELNGTTEFIKKIKTEQ